ncbi:MAG: hypothetical protein WCF23_06890, partial [Candidatus Nitrosopolaris sp.]
MNTLCCRRIYKERGDKHATSKVVRIFHAKNNHDTIVITLFLLLISVSLVNCNNGPLAAYVQASATPRIQSSSLDNNISANTNNGTGNTSLQLHPYASSEQPVQQRSLQLQLPQPGPLSPPSSLSLRQQIPTPLSQPSSSSLSSSSASLTTRLLSPEQQQALQQQSWFPQQQQALQQQSSFQQQQQEQLLPPKYRSWFPSLPASSCPGTFQLTIDGLASLGS